MVGAPVIAAATDVEAEHLATTVYKTFLNLVRGHPRLASPPVDSMEGLWTPMEEAHVRRMLEISVIGGPERIRSGLQHLVEMTGCR